MAKYCIEIKRILLPEGRFVWRWFIMKNCYPLFTSNPQHNWCAVWRVVNAFQARHTNLLIAAAVGEHKIEYTRRPLTQLPPMVCCVDTLEIFYDEGNRARMQILPPGRRTVLRSKGYRTAGAAVKAATALQAALGNFKLLNNTVGVSPGPPTRCAEIVFKRRPRLKGEF